MVAQVPIEDALRLDVMILPFDPNLERIETVDSDIPISAEVRRAESRYQAYHLKETLEQTGNWGVVRVIPSPTNFQPLLVQAKILASDGENLRLFVKQPTRPVQFGSTKNIRIQRANMPTRA